MRYIALRTLTIIGSIEISGDAMILRNSKIGLLLLVILAAAALPACSSRPQSNLRMMPMSDMPAGVQASASVVQQSYQFAAANPDIMKGVPCYCGCGNLGHTSNYSCYVSAVDGQGKITYDNHALGCSLCVNITQDTMRLLKEGKTGPEIRAYVDATYGKYGTSNMP